MIDDNTIKKETETNILKADEKNDLINQKQVNERDMSIDESLSSKRLKTDKIQQKTKENSEENSINSKYESMQPRLKKFLKIYQLSSRNSLNGPGPTDLEMSLNQPVTSLSEKNSKIDTNQPGNENEHEHDNDSDNNANESSSLAIIANVAVAAAAAAAVVAASATPLSKEVETEIEVETEVSNSAAQNETDKKNQQHNQHNQHPHSHKKLKSSNSQSPSFSNKLFLKSNSNLKYLKCIQADQDTSQLMETLLHGERISCFIVGGEKRLCLHDILNTILKDFSVQQINSACQKLSIACLESTPKQLEILKRNHLLPPGAPNCGLLTQTNAERLCAFLMDSSLSEQIHVDTPPSSTSSSPASLTPTTLKVVHECFGKTYGHVHLNMYSRSDSACVECDTCRKLYSPKNFVCHTHKYETHTRHWGFDSSNWRIYLKLITNVSNICEENKNVLSDLKISNKDNIAANISSSSSTSSNNSNSTNNDIKDKEKYLLIQEEEFEIFKQKFLSLEAKSSNLNNANHINQNQLQRGSLADLNNQFMNKNHNSKNSTEHKLLNGLLSKPLENSSYSATSSNIPIVQQCLNQPNIVIQNNTIGFDQIIKTNGLQSNINNQNKQNSNNNLSVDKYSNTNQILNNNSNITNNNNNNNNNKFLINDEFSLNEIQSALKQSSNQAQSSAQITSPLLYYNLLNSKLLNKSLGSFSNPQLTLNQANPATSIELNMLDLILNEIDLCVENKDNLERLKQMVTQMHIYFSEKLNDQYYIKNKILSEFEEFKISLQNENEQLRCQLKLFQIQNELINKEHYLVNRKNSTSTTGIGLNNFKMNSSNPINASAASPSSLTSTSNTHSSSQLNKNPNNILQNILLLQQQNNNTTGSNPKNNNDQLQAAAAACAAAAQSLPQFFFNHYNAGLSHRNNFSSLLEPITSTPKKINQMDNSSSSFNNSKYPNSNILKCEANLTQKQNQSSSNTQQQTSATV